MKLDLFEIAIVLAVFILTIIVGCISLFASEYIGEVWRCDHNNGISEMIVYTGACMSKDLIDYAKENNITIKDYIYIKKNKKKITHFESANSFDEIMAKQNASSVASNKKVKKFTYNGNGASLKANLKDWKEGKVFNEEIVL